MVRQIKTSCLIFLAIISAATNAGASEDEGRDERYQHVVGMTGELTSSTTWQLEASYHWFPVKFAGIGASVGFWKQIEYDGMPATDEWRLSEDSRSMKNAFFMPSIILFSPAIIKTEEMDIGIMAEPGFMMNIGYDKAVIEITHGTGIPQDHKKVSCNNGRWYAFNLRVGVYARFDQVTISSGYAYSDLDIYAMRRNMRYQNIKFGEFYPKKKNIGAFFLRASYSF